MVLIEAKLFLLPSQVLEKHRTSFAFEVSEDDVEGRWLRNGVEIQFSVEERFNYIAVKKMHRITISETYRSDAGEYTFIAGKNRSTMTLRVNSKSTEKKSDFSIQGH